VSLVQVKYALCLVLIAFSRQDTPYPHEVSSNAVDTNVYPQHVSPPVSSLPPVPFQASHDVAGPSGYTRAFGFFDPLPPRVPNFMSL